MTQTSPPHMLVVGADPASVSTIATIVRETGHEVLTAQDGAEAMARILEDGPQVVIADCTTPNVDGLELCRAIRTHEGVAFTYIIIVAAECDEDRMVAMFDADDSLSKPVQRRELLARLRAGVRTVRLQQDLDRRHREVHLTNARMAIAQGELADANHKLKRMATTDELTGLVNRREALTRLEEYWASSSRHHGPLACIMLDIDHFKSINDTYGHAVGDRVLKETASVLQRSARREEKVCRVGGEEFLVLCPQSTEAMVATAAERLRRAVEAHVVRCDDRALRTTISLGAAERTVDMLGPDDLLKAADAALYAAKEGGRNRMCVASASHPAAAGDTQRC